MIRGEGRHAVVGILRFREHLANERHHALAECLAGIRRLGQDGAASLDEVAEIELTQCLETQEIYTRLSSTFPPGLSLKAVKALPPRRAGQVPRRIQYRLHLKEAGLQVQADRLLALLRAPTLPFRRPRENSIQDVDLRPALRNLELQADGDLLIDITPGRKGSVRPLEVLSLALNAPLNSLRQVRVIKLRMELDLLAEPQG